MAETEQGRLVVVSNRLPVVLKRQAGSWEATPGAGGLVTALTPVLKQRGGVWIGWPGVVARASKRRTDREESQTSEQERIDAALNATAAETGYILHPVMLSQEEIDGFYYGFANEILWPLFHGFETRCNFNPAYWRDYETANEKFAAAVLEHCQPTDFVWIHDYHLMLAGRELRRAEPGLRLAYFLHIPFPTPDVFFKLPWRAQILEGLLAFDLVGFQTRRDRCNFTDCLRLLRLPKLKISGRSSTVTIEFSERISRAGAFPISIDFTEISTQAGSAEVAEGAWLFHEQFPERQIILGMDRLDYTKGIPERLTAFRTALAQYPALRGKVTLVQVTVPSRENVPEYERLRAEIEQLVGEINGEYTIPGWIPVHYLHRSFPRKQVLSMLRAAEIALVTPLRDGMNLVAKEFCACDIDQRGVLILSEFAGAASELKRGAIVVNPYDVEGTANAIHTAVHMPATERRSRMKRMREQIRQHDIYHWVDTLLGAAANRLVEGPAEAENLVPDIKLQLENLPKESKANT